MCGIIGYVGEKEIVPLLINGLKRLEYRGYDSFGFCIQNNSNLEINKKQGKISSFVAPPELKNISNTIGVAHTRWATHGRPNETNAHPHLDCKNEIALVHNGIIENYSTLKELLIKKGHRIISETDSEVLSHLIEEFYSGDLEAAVSKALKLVEGTFGLAVIHKQERRIVAARRGSPLVIGVGDNGMIVSSDATAVLDHTRRLIYLHDNEIASVEKDSYYVKDIEGEKVNKEIHEIKWNVGQIEKKGFKHFMLKEIFEQPEALENVLRGRIRNERIKLSVNFDAAKLNRIIITACGTSWHAALVGKYLIERIVNIPVEVDYASEFRYRNPMLKENDLVVVVSQSGETADTLAALREAKSKNVDTLGIINVVGSTVSREVGSGIYTHAGPEIGVASTKAFTSQVITLLLLALFIRQKKGLKLDSNLLREIMDLPGKVKECLSMSEDIRRIADNFKSSKHFLYLGRGINFPVALEGALKLKEISYIHAEGYPAAEMKHGPIALIDEDMPVVFLATNGTIFEKVLSNMEEVKSRGGRIITITDKKNPVIDRLSDHVITVPSAVEEISSVVNVIPLQLLAYHIADIKGLDIDKPRNLAKSVTVE